MSKNNISIRIEVSQTTKAKLKEINNRRKSQGYSKLGYRYFFEEGVNKIYDETFSENSDERQLRELDLEISEMDSNLIKMKQEREKLANKINGNDLYGFMKHINYLLNDYRKEHDDASIEDFVKDKYNQIMGVYKQSSFKDNNLDSPMMETDEDKIEIFIKIIKENIKMYI